MASIIDQVYYCPQGICHHQAEFVYSEHRTGMQSFKFHTIDPPPELAQYVRSFWVFEGNERNGEPYIYRSMADACAEMVFHYKGVWQGLSVNDEVIAGSDELTTLHSPADNYQRFTTNGDFGIFGVYLYPYSLHSLFGLSGCELRNETVTIADCLRSKGRELEEQILTARNNRERVNILSAFLIRRSRAAKAPDTAIQACIKLLVYRPTAQSVGETADMFCISSRQLERKFKTLTGFAPKSFARISRFQHALRRYGSNYKSLTDLAYECGYYDQSHFIHDFRKFSGYEPRSYFAGKSEGIEYREA